MHILIKWYGTQRHRFMIAVPEQFSNSCFHTSDRTGQNIQIYRCKCTVQEHAIEQSVLLCRFTEHEGAFWLFCLVYQEHCTMFDMEFYRNGELFRETNAENSNLWFDRSGVFVLHVHWSVFVLTVEIHNWLIHYQLAIHAAGRFWNSLTLLIRAISRRSRSGSAIETQLPAIG